MDREVWFYSTLTIWTHSMSGSLTAWLPTRDTTQAGVVAEASSKASTASTPMRLACKTKDISCLKTNKSTEDLFDILSRLSWWSLRRNKNIYQDPVKGRRSPASLHVAQDGDPGVKAQSADDQLDKKRKTVKILCWIQQKKKHNKYICTGYHISERVNKRAGTRF